MDREQARQLLEIPSDATPEQVKQAFRRQVKRWHPDRIVGDPERKAAAQEQLIRITTAYEALTAAHDDPIPSDGQFGAVDPFETDADGDPGTRRRTPPRRQWRSRILAVGVALTVLSAFPVVMMQVFRGSPSAEPPDGIDADSVPGLVRQDMPMDLQAQMVGELLSPQQTADSPQEMNWIDSVLADLQPENAVTLRLRNCLTALGYTDENGMGPVDAGLRDAVQRFCQDFSFQPGASPADDLIETVSVHAVVAKRHPDYRDVVASGVLGEWIATQRYLPPGILESIRSSRNPRKLSALVNLYKFDRLSPSPSSLPASGLFDPEPAGGIAPVTLQADSSGLHHFIKILSAADQTTATTAFLRSGEALQIHLPLGRYTIRYATGRTWYGPDYLFGTETLYSSQEKTYVLHRTGNRVNGYRIHLTIRPNGDTASRILSGFLF